MAVDSTSTAPPPPAASSKAKPEELSEEDIQLKEQLNMLVDRLQEPKEDLHIPALESLRTLIRTSTTSMTAVPKPLKFLRERFDDLRGVYGKWIEGSERSRFLADILSVLAMTFSAPMNVSDSETDPNDVRLTLRYRMAGMKESIDSWGHEYVRHLAMEIVEEYREIGDGSDRTGELLVLIFEMVPFFLSHNAEPMSCDLLLEIQQLPRIVEWCDEGNYRRICEYLMGCVAYEAYPDDVAILQIIHDIYFSLGKYSSALLTSLKIGKIDLIQGDYDACEDPHLKSQLAFIITRHGVSLTLPEDDPNGKIFGNSMLPQHFSALAKELDVVKPVALEDVYKSHLEKAPIMGGTSIDSAKQNLAGSFVNALTNLAFGVDPLMLPKTSKNDDVENTDQETDDDADKDNKKDQMEEQKISDWIFKTKDAGMLSTAASIGAISFWNPEDGLGRIDQYLYSNDENIQAGANLGIGIMHIGIRNEYDAALALLSEHVDSEKPLLRKASIVGLGMAYAGTCKQEICDLLLPIVSDSSLTVELNSVAALSLGHVFTGSCNGDIASTILQCLMERSVEELASCQLSRYLGLGLALLYLGKQESADAILETIRVLPPSLSRDMYALVDMCAWAGSGNVLKVQEFLHLCTDAVVAEKDQTAADGAASGDANGGEDQQSAPKNKAEISTETTGLAAIGIAMVASGEKIGSSMVRRTFKHLMHYGDASTRRCVPLALGYLCVSDPDVEMIDTLSKYSHDSDGEVAANSILAMGLVGAGTKQARLAQLLRSLAVYYRRDSRLLFAVRLAQGMVHMGKGLVTLSPRYSETGLMMSSAVGGLLTVILAFTRHHKASSPTDSATSSEDSVENGRDSIILGEENHYLAYWMLLAAQPRCLITLDEELNLLPCLVRVGQAVDTVGLAGKPKKITGFQTHTTPVLLAAGEKAEIATNEYFPLTSALEGIVILRKNPEFVK